MTAKAPPVSRPRDPRLDFFRGVGMFIILIAHITDNPWTLWIPARFGFSDATEMFVFCSGMASALAFGAVFSRAGFGYGCLRIAHRVWQVYWVHIGVFLVTLAVVLALNATGIFPRDEVDILNLHVFLDHAGPAVLGLLTLTYVPNYFDVLPMYLVILAMIPVMVALARVEPLLAVGASVSVWAVATTTGMNLPAELWVVEGSTRPWFFNPFAWQLVFFTGFALMAGWLPAPPVRRWLIGLSAAFVIVSVPFAWHHTLHTVEAVRDLRNLAPSLFDKTNFGALRYVHFLALAYLAWVVVGPGGARLTQGRAVTMVVAVISRVGQQSLAVFATSMVLARALGALLSLWGGGPLATLAVNLIGFAAIIAVAALSALFKRQPWKVPAQRPAAMQAPSALGSEVRT